MKNNMYPMIYFCFNFFFWFYFKLCVWVECMFRCPESPEEGNWIPQSWSYSQL